MTPTIAPRMAPIRFAPCATLALGLVAAGGPAAAVTPTKVGAEIVVSTSPNYVEAPRVAMDPGGSFMVVWEDGYDETAKAKAFYGNGNEQGPIFWVSSPEHEVKEGGFTPDELVSVAADAAGNFVVAFNAYDATAPNGSACTNEMCIYTKRRDVNGLVSPATFIVGDPRLNPYGSRTYNQTANPEITADGDGNFILVWEGIDYDPPNIDEGVWARKMVGSGQVNGGPFRVNAVTTAYQGDAGEVDVAADGAGNFTVVWDDGNYAAPPYSGVVMAQFDKFKNPLGSQVRVSADRGFDLGVAMTTTGETMVIWEDGDLKGRVYDSSGTAVGPEFLISNSAEYAEISAAGPSSFVVVWNDVGMTGRIYDTTGTATGAEFTTTSTTGYLGDVSADADGNFVMVWKEDSYEWRAQRWELVPSAPSEIPLLGKVMVISNKIPDDFEKSKGKWKASGEAIEIPLRGSVNDPRCNGDPEGTVKASARFVSATSGEDTGPIPLPCQNWSVTGSTKVNGVEKRGYKYKDGKREDGPCNAVTIKGTKSVSVSCKGKPGVATFTYDLMDGAPQGDVVGSLTLGNLTYCAEFAPFSDGSDGKKFKGKSVAAPASCPPALHPTPTPIPSPTPSPTPTPSPGSPSGAFVDGPVRF